MRKLEVSFLAMLGLVFVLVSCGKKESGELTGVQDRPSWSAINPYGMVYVPSGRFQQGQSDQDVFTNYIQRPRTVTIQGFYMDDTEITNNEYRQFYNWVKDSVAHTLMGDFIEDEYGNEKLDWEYELDYSDEALDEMFYQGDMAIDGKRELDITKLNYKYDWINWQKAASKSAKGMVRSELINKKEINIMPDTLCWIRDYGYAYNEPMALNYFWHPAFDDYPVVGVNWVQANAFCHWRTKLWNNSNGKQINSQNFRLPTESEWEYAARGGLDMAPYPWGGYYIRNAKGCLLANFKPGRGNYSEDGGAYTVKVDSYFPNGYGLYNMSGNVAEWTNSAFNENSYNFENDMNPNYTYNASDADGEEYRRKVIRGGSWKDISYFLQTGTRHWEYQDTSKSYIGFRCALSFLGRSPKDY